MRGFLGTVVGALAAYVVACAGVSAGFSWWTILILVVVPFVMGFMVVQVIAGAVQDVGKPLWRLRHVRKYGLSEHYWFISMYDKVLRKTLQRGSPLDEAACLALVTLAPKNQGDFSITSQVVAMGEAAGYIERSPHAAKFSPSEFAGILRQLSEFDQESLVALIGRCDDPALVARYVGLTSSTEAALIAVEAGIAPEYASAI